MTSQEKFDEVRSEYTVILDPKKEAYTEPVRNLLVWVRSPKELIELDPIEIEKKLQTARGKSATRVVLEDMLKLSRKDTKEVHLFKHKTHTGFYLIEVVIPKQTWNANPIVKRAFQTLALFGIIYGSYLTSSYLETERTKKLEALQREKELAEREARNAKAEWIEQEVVRMDAETRRQQLQALEYVKLVKRKYTLLLVRLRADKAKNWKTYAAFLAFIVHQLSQDVLVFTEADIETREGIQGLNRRCNLAAFLSHVKTFELPDDDDFQDWYKENRKNSTFRGAFQFVEDHSDWIEKWNGTFESFQPFFKANYDRNLTFPCQKE